MRAVGLEKILGFYLGLVTVALAALWARHGLATILPASGRAWLVGTGLGAGVAVVIVVGTRVLVARTGWAKLLAQELRGIVGELRRGEALAVALLSGVGEETLFRGVLQPLLGLWLTSLLFGLLHIGPNRRFVPWTLMACAAGLIFGAMFAWTGNLFTPILAHVLTNYLNLRFLSADDGGSFVELGPRPEGGSSSDPGR